jgi:hypothetical protein
MSDQEFAKKFEEEVDLEDFLEAYEYVTGERIAKVRSSERPDFICVRENDEHIGIELTKVMRDPESAFWDLTLRSEKYMDPIDAIMEVGALLDKKETLRKQDDWLFPDNTILVFQLMDAPLAEVGAHLDNDLQKDFSETGFKEIWLADYTLLEPYGVVELFGLYPLDWWEYYRREDLGKPFG